MKIEIITKRKDKNEVLKIHLAILSLVFVLTAVFSFMLFIGIEKNNELKSVQNEEAVKEVFMESKIHEILGFSDTQLGENEKI